MAGLRILVTRPAHQAQTLCRLLEDAGATALRLPLLAIEPVADADSAREKLKAACDADWWIFTSVNAVHHAAALSPPPWPPKLAAIGLATAEALSGLGCEVAAKPAQDYSSEGLLDLPEFGDIGGRRVVIVTGEGGRELLAQQLQARGAAVETVAVYRRAPVAHEAAEVAAALANSDAIVVTSGAALKHLVELSGAEVFGKQLVAPGARVVEQARQLGFRRSALAPESMSDEAIVRCLEQWRHAMPESEPRSPSEAAPVSPTSAPRRSGAWRAWLLVAVLAGALGYGGWWLWQFHAQTGDRLAAQDALIRRLDAESARLQARLTELENRAAQTAEAARRNGDALGALGGRVNGLEQSVGRLGEAVEAGRGGIQRIAVEQLLLLANERLQLARDAAGAGKALELVEQRLAALDDPRLFKVREAVARERAALAAVPAVDVTGAALALDGIEEQVPRLSLAARVPPRFESQPAPAPKLPLEAPWYQRLWAKVRAALASTFALRRQESGVRQLLPPNEEALVRTILTLKLESARAALLRGDQASFRRLCFDARGWLGDYFRKGDAGVQAAAKELDRLAGLELNPELPDISQSLTLLRAQLGPSAQ